MFILMLVLEKNYQKILCLEFISLFIAYPVIS